MTYIMLNEVPISAILTLILSSRPCFNIPTLLSLFMDCPMVPVWNDSNNIITFKKSNKHCQDNQRTLEQTIQCVHSLGYHSLIQSFILYWNFNPNLFLDQMMMQNDSLFINYDGITFYQKCIQIFQFR